MNQNQINILNQTQRIKLNQSIKKRMIQTIAIKPSSRTINQQHFLIQSFKKQLKRISKQYDRQALLQCIDYLKISERYNVTINFINPYDLISKLLISQANESQQNISQRKNQSLQIQKKQQGKSMKFQQINFSLQNVYWIVIINGSLQFHGVKYQEGQSLFFNKDDYKFIKNLKICQYIYLNNEDLQKIRKSYQLRQNKRCQFFIKNILLYNYLVPQNQLVNMFNQLKIQKFKNRQVVFEGQPDQFIRILYKGNIQIEVEWKRTIRLCELTSGCIFNGPILQKYINKHDSRGTTTSKLTTTNKNINSFNFQFHSKRFFAQKQLNSYQNVSSQSCIQKFKYVCTSQQATIIIFNMKLLQQSPLNINIQLKQSLEKTYRKRVQKVQQIKKQPSYNKLHRMKKSYQKQMKRNKQKQECKKNITQIEYLQDKSIRQRFFTKKGEINILQKPQSCRNNSSQKYLNPRYRKIQLHLTSRVKNDLTKSNFFSQQKKNKTKQNKNNTVNIVQVDFSLHKDDIPYSTIDESEPQIFSTSKSPQNIKKVKSFSTLKLRPYTKSNSNIKLENRINHPKNLFVPQQFVNRKLRLQFQNILKNVRTLPLYQNPQQEQINTQKEIYIQNNKRFEKYIEEKKVMNKRIMKYYGNSHKYIKK